MSLVKTDTDRVLFKFVNEPRSLEAKTNNFWHKILSKEYFPEEYYFTSHEAPPSEASEDRRRRVDFHIGRIDFRTETINVIAFIEGKRAHASKDAQDEVIAQVFNACQSHIWEYPQYQSVYGICVVGGWAKCYLYRGGSSPEKVIGEIIGKVVPIIQKAGPACTFALDDAMKAGPYTSKGSKLVTPRRTHLLTTSTDSRCVCRKSERNSIIPQEVFPRLVHHRWMRFAKSSRLLQVFAEESVAMTGWLEGMDCWLEGMD